MAMNNPYKQYQQNSVTTATPEELTLKLYNGILKFSNVAKLEMEAKNIEKTNIALGRAQDIVDELNYTLNMDYEVSQGLRDLYIFIKEQLVEANIQKNVDILNDIIPIVESMRDTWKEAIVIAKQQRLQPSNEVAGAN